MQAHPGGSPLLALALTLGLTVGLAGPVPAEPAPESSPLTPFRIDTASRKVPAGTLLKIAFNSAMDSRITQPGEPFTAFIAEDFKSSANPSADVSGDASGGDVRVILPKGTLVRGRVSEVKKPGLFSRGGAITLSFDHVVVPTGQLLPLDLNLSAQNDRVRKLGKSDRLALYEDPGIGYKVHKGVEAGADTFQRIQKSGVEAGQQIAGGAGVLVTVPASIVGGALAGGAVTTGKAIAAVVGRGESTVIDPGDTVTIDFGDTFTLPAD